MTEAVATPAFRKLQEAKEKLAVRTTKVYAAYQKARDAATAVEAENIRLTTLMLAEEQPSLTGLTFETDYSSDDEGGMFESATVYFTFPDGEGEPSQVVDIDVSEDGCYDFSPEGVRLFFGATEQEDSGEITIQAVRAMGAF